MASLSVLVTVGRLYSLSPLSLPFSPPFLPSLSPHPSPISLALTIVMLKLKFGKDIKHNTFWKFSCSLLRDKEYLDQVNTEIRNVTEEYAADHYDRSALHNIPKSKIELSIPDKLFLDFMFMKIRSETIAYASMKKKKTQEKEHNLQKSIKEIETRRKNRRYKISTRKRSRINFITRKKDGRSSIEVKSKMGC